MNKPLKPLVPDSDMGFLDEHGQQVRSPEEEVAIERLHADPAYQAGLDLAEADVTSGRFHTGDEMILHSKERKRRWFAERQMAPPPGYFDH